MAAKKSKRTKFALCLTNFEPDLKLRKVYEILPDEAAEKSKCLRVVDESGEDYLYPAKCFVIVEIPLNDKRRTIY